MTRNDGPSYRSIAGSSPSLSRFFLEHATISKRHDPSASEPFGNGWGKSISVVSGFGWGREIHDRRLGFAIQLDVP